jgi:NADH-quinone oxidoreductase subunit G
VHLGLPDANAARRELNTLVPDVTSSFPDIPSAIPTGGAPATTAGPSGRPPRASHTSTLQPGPGQAFLATWHNLLDAGRMQDGEPNLAGTARAAVAKMSAATAAEAGVGDGGKVTVATERGTITVPAEIADMPDRVVWLPTNSAGCAVRDSLGAGHGSLVTVRSAE